MKATGEQENSTNDAVKPSILSTNEIKNIILTATLITTKI